MTVISADQTVDLLLYILESIHWLSSIELLQQAIALASSDELYKIKMEQTLCIGSTLSIRELFSPFGNYLESSQANYPFYPHTDAVNGIDFALHWVKLNCFETSIEEYNSHLC